MKTGLSVFNRLSGRSENINNVPGFNARIDLLQSPSDVHQASCITSSNVFSTGALDVGDLSFDHHLADIRIHNTGDSAKSTANILFWQLANIDVLNLIEQNFCLIFTAPNLAINGRRRGTLPHAENESPTGSGSVLSPGIHRIQKCVTPDPKQSRAHQFLSGKE